MTPDPSKLPPVPNTDPGLIRLLREDLAAADWTVETVEEILGPVGSAALARGQRIPALAALAGRQDPASLLTRAFILGGDADLGPALPRLGLAGARSLGLVDNSDTPTVDLRPHAAELPSGTHNWWVASDRAEMQTGQPLHPEHVLGIGPATLALLRLTSRAPVSVALDVGTGCGIQALYLSTHAKRVVATDLSERACQFARFNGALNQADFEVRQGSLFDPVANEVFDLIVSNPPFVITPEAVRRGALHEYRDAGLPGDTLVSRLVIEGAGLLRPGGLLQSLLNWEIPAASPRENRWEAPLRDWVERAEVACAPDRLAAWAVLRERVDPAEYTELWLRDEGADPRKRDRWEADYRNWFNGFEESRTSEIGMGFIALRRLERDQPGAGGFHAEYLGEETLPTGAGVERVLANLSLDPDWEERRLLRAADVRELRHYRPGSADPEIIILTQGSEMARQIQVGTAVAALVGAADGELTAGQVVTALAALTGRDTQAIRTEVSEGLPALLQAGMVQFLPEEKGDAVSTFTASLPGEPI